MFVGFFGKWKIVFFTGHKAFGFISEVVVIILFADAGLQGRWISSPALVCGVDKNPDWMAGFLWILKIYVLFPCETPLQCVMFQTDMVMDL